MKSVTLVLLIGLLALASSASVQSAPIEPVPFKVPAKLDDVAQLVSPSRIELGGWLGARVKANAANRLLNVDLEPLLAGYRKRPGSHPWIGEHIGKWLHAATLAWVNNGDPALKAKIDKAVADLAERFRAALEPADRTGVALSAAEVRALVDEPLPEGPGAVETVTSARLSGRPCVRLAKSVYLNVAKLRWLITHEPSAVPIWSRASLPRPVDAASFDSNSTLLSSRFESL